MMISIMIVILRITSNHMDNLKVHHLLKLPMLKVPKAPNPVVKIRMLPMAGIRPILRFGGPILRSKANSLNLVKARLGQHRLVVDLPLICYTEASSSL